MLNDCGYYEQFCILYLNLVQLINQDIKERNINVKII